MANATIEGKDCTLFFDYDCTSGVINSLSDDGKIEWLERRMNMIFLDPLRKIIDRNSTVFSQLEHPPGEPPMTAMLMAVSLLMNGMEALGSFLTNLSDNNKRFYAFVDKYMPTWTILVNSPHHWNKPLSEILWKSYRNGLAHSFVILHAGIEPVGGNSKYHISSGALQIDGWKLFDDLQLGVSQMFKDVRTDAGAKSLFLTRFNDVYNC